MRRAFAALTARNCNAAAQVHYNTVKSADGVKSAGWLIETTVLHGSRSRLCGVLQPWATPGFVRPYGPIHRATALHQGSAPQKMRHTHTQTGTSRRKCPLRVGVAEFSDDFRLLLQCFMLLLDYHCAMSISTLLKRKLASNASRPKSLPIPERL